MFKEVENKKIFELLGILLSFSLIILIWAVTINLFSSKPHIGLKLNDTYREHKLEVNGRGVVYVKPDIAKLDIGLISEGKTVKEVLQKNSSKMNNVISALKKADIKEDDIKTIKFDLRPKYKWLEQGFSQSKKLVGFGLTQTLEVKIRDLKNVGKVISLATESGANNIENLRFEVENKNKVKEEVRKKAIEDAKKRARDIASALGVKLVKIISYSESSYTPFPVFRAANIKSFKGEEDSVPSIQSGLNKVEVNVSISYLIE